MAVIMAAVSQQARDSDLVGLQQTALDLAPLATRLGLCEVARAVAQVKICAQTADAAVLAATVARLNRAFEMSIDHVWDY
jgi:hypothetical protein